MPFALLRCLAGAVAKHGVKFVCGIVMPGYEAVYEIASDAYQDYRRDRKEDRLRAEVQALAQVPAEQVRQEVQAAVLAVAAHLSLGVDPQELGPPVSEWVRLPLPAPVLEERRLVGEVAYVDDFGNLLTNIPAAAFEKLAADHPAVTEFRNSLANSHNNLGILFSLKGQTDEAIRHYREALRLRPDFASARNNLDNLLAAKPKLQESR